MRSSTTRARRALLSFAWCLACGAPGCADTGPEQTLQRAAQKIAGADAAAPADWPAVVSLGGCTGTLIHPRLVLYAAHCGTAIPHVRFGVDARRPERLVAVDYCRAHPRATLGDGTDLAYCVLSEEARDVTPARVLAGCERLELVVGREVSLVGFGVEADGAEYGTQRAARATVTELGHELLVAGEGVDTCVGDSGGPVLLPVEDGTAWRVVGVTSAGTSRRCGEGEAHYVNLAPQLDWLEQSSGLDVTPCFDGAEWSPTPACTATDGGEPRWLSTCGAAWQEPEDSQAPSLRVLVPKDATLRETLNAGESYFETPVQVLAEDSGSGVKSVTFTLRDGAGETLTQRVDEVPPYGIASLRLPMGAYTLLVQAADFSGRIAELSRQLRIEPPTAPSTNTESGCGVSGRGSRGGWLGCLASVVVLGALRRSRGRVRANERA